MCNPAAAAQVAAMVIAAGGAYMNSKEQSKNLAAQQRARQQASAAELARQKNFQRENQDTLAKTLQPFEAENQTQARQEAVDDRTQASERAVEGTPAVDIPISGSAPNIVQSSMADSLAKAMDRARDYGRRSADLRAFGDLFGGNTINVARAGDRIGTVNSMARSSANLSGYEMGAAAHNAMRPPSGVGDALQIGGAALGAAGGGAFGNIFGTAQGAPFSPAMATRLTTPGYFGG
jgi:hypothetical protein